ncbi:MAG TPA: TonB-dependent siderophore receptor [Marinilabiliales bacterium]|nr:TonB-dependent siderophore receptor [Marinilabiliales bacterium]
MIQRRILLGIFLFIETVSVIAQTGNISGKVTTSDGNAAEYVNIILVGANKGTIVNAQGTYEIKEVRAGTFTLRVSFVGLVPQNKQIQVEADKTTTVDFVLNENSEELKEVVVIANPSKYVTDYPSITLRLKTPLLEVPQNIQVVTKQIIQDQQIFDMLEGVTRNVSGATRVEHWDNYAQINMRGSQIAGFRNGMNVQSTWGPLTEDMSMVERIEFVKGPAGFMLANGEPSGFYNVVTKKPTGVTKGEATMTIGSFDTYRTTLDFDGKLNKEGTLLYRLNVMGQMKGSHRDYEYNNRFSFAPVLKFQFTPQTSLTAEYTYQFNQMSVIGSNYAFSARKMGELPVNFTTAEPNMLPTNIHDNTFFITLAHTINSNWRFTGQMAYMHYNQLGQSIWPTGFSANGDTLYRAASNWDVLGIIKVGQFFVNGDVNTGIIGHRILVGIDMGDKDFYHDWSQGGSISGLSGFNIYNPVYGQVPGSSYPVYDRTLDIRERGVYYSNKYAALYVQDEICFFDNKLRFTLAGRYTSAHDADPYSGNGIANKLTPRLGLSYSINKNTSTYAVFDEAFIPQVGSDFNGNSFDPISGNNMELGLKKEWLDGLWTASMAAYQITKNNILTADSEHQYFSIQLGQTQTRGIEFDIRGQIFQGLDVTLNYAYTEGKITKDTDPEQVGAQIPGTSKNVTNIWLNYRVSKGIANGLGISCGMQYAGGRSNWYGAYDNSSQMMPDYSRFDGAISYQINKFGIAMNINNLFNTYLYSGAYYSWSSLYYWQAEAKRNYRLTINYKF